MIAKICSAVPRGVEALPVQVEVESHQGIPSLTVVGLPDAAVREARERVLTAIRQLGVALDTRAIVVNLSPAEERKEGSLLDLPIAIGLLTAAGLLPQQAAAGLWLVGELSLDGGLRPVRGVLPIAEAATRAGAGLVVPSENLAEAVVIRAARVIPARTFNDLVAHLRGERLIAPVLGRNGPPAVPPAEEYPDLADVAGQDQAKRALEIAAAGGHNLLLLGPPGTGKTMLAQRLPGILPPLTEEEALATTKIYSVAPGVERPQGLLWRRPFRAPHHSISAAGLVGGGSVPRPGEVSLAHNGVLFLDEVTEFRRDVLEVLRQPMESGHVVLTRAAGSLTFPARFQLVAAANPCPCGFLGDPRRECRCSPREVERYRGRLSGPLLDRIDLQLEVPAVPYRELAATSAREGSQAVACRVRQAREVQLARLSALGRRTNADMSPADLRRHCAVNREGARLLELAMEKLALSARGVNRILKVARTIADLDGSPTLLPRHLAEAIAYRTLDRRPGG